MSHQSNTSEFHNSRDQLIRLKRSTGLKNWNTLCRWAFCLSLRDPARPSAQDIKADSNLEMTWRVFAATTPTSLLALFTLRCKRDGVPAEDPHQMATEFRLHLHRGIAMLSSVRDASGIGPLIARLLR